MSLLTPLLTMTLGPILLRALNAWVSRRNGARRRAAVAAGRTVYLRCELDDRSGHLLVDRERGELLYLAQRGPADTVPLDGTVTDLIRSVPRPFSFALAPVRTLRYRTREGAVREFRLMETDAETLRLLLSDPAAWSATAPSRRRFLQLPTWCALPLLLAAVFGAVGGESYVFGHGTTATVTGVHAGTGFSDSTCAVTWGAADRGGVHRAGVDCSGHEQVGQPLRVVARPWPFSGQAADLYDSRSWLTIFIGALLGVAALGTALPLLLAHRRNRRIGPGPWPPLPVPEPLDADAPEADSLPTDPSQLRYGPLAAAAHYGDAHRPGRGVSLPRPRSSRSTRGWFLLEVLGSTAWIPLAFAALLAGLCVTPGEHPVPWNPLTQLGLALVALACVARIVQRSVATWPKARRVRQLMEAGPSRPMRYVRLHGQINSGPKYQPWLVLFDADDTDGDGDEARPRYAQRVRALPGSVRGTLGVPAPVGVAQVSGGPEAGAVVCEIAGHRYLPHGELRELSTKSRRKLLLTLAGGYRLPTGPN